MTVTTTFFVGGGAYQGPPGGQGATGPSGIAVKANATLVAGTVTIATGSVHPTSVFTLAVKALGTVSSAKDLRVANIVDGVSFDIVSTDATDTSVVSWAILTP